MRNPLTMEMLRKKPFQHTLWIFRRFRVAIFQV